MTKLCNYCKNHSISVNEKGHRPCKYNNQLHFETCKPCNQNYKKTLNVKIWRAKKKPERETIKIIFEDLMKVEEEILSLHGNVSMKSNSTPEDYLPEVTVDFIIEEESNSIDEDEFAEVVELPEQDQMKSGYALVLQHPKYPNAILNADDVMRFEHLISQQIDAITGKKVPKFISNHLENGIWRVDSGDKFTYDWFISKASMLTCFVDNEEVPVRVISSCELSKFTCLAFIPGVKVDSNTILYRFQKQNLGIDTSRWKITGIEQQEQQFVVSFLIDQLSLKTIQEKNYILYFGMNRVTLAICEETSAEFEGDDESVDDSYTLIEVA